MLVAFVSSFLILGVLGVWAPTEGRTLLARICSVIYFAFFLLMPIWTSLDKTKPVPERVTTDGGIGFWGSMAGLLLILALTVLPLKVVAAEGEDLYELLYGLPFTAVFPLQQGGHRSGYPRGPV